MKKLCYAIALLLPIVTHAQVQKCTGPDGKVTYTEAGCGSAGTTKTLSTELTPDQRTQAMAESKQRVDSDRMQTIQLMISNGKIGEARAYARTADERAIVRDADQAAKAERKTAMAEAEAVEKRRQREIERGQKKKW